MFIINTVSACFGHHYAHLQENKTCVTACGVLCWLVAVVGRCVVGCEQCEGRTVTFTVLAPYNTAPHNRHQPHPGEPAQHTACSNTRSLFFWRWAKWCPKHVETEVHNKHLIVASCWFSLSSHFAHDARSQEPKSSGNFLPTFWDNDHIFSGQGIFILEPWRWDR